VKEWGHVVLPRVVYGNKPAGTTRGTKTLSCPSLIVTDLHTSLVSEEVRMLTMLRMNVSLMEYMSTRVQSVMVSTHGLRSVTLE